MPVSRFLLTLLLAFSFNLLSSQTISNDSLIRLCAALEHRIQRGADTACVRDIGMLSELETEMSSRLELDRSAVPAYTQVCCILALYHQNIELDFATSLNYGFKALQTARQYHITINEAQILNLISGTYSLKQDTLSLKYALEAHDIAKSQGDTVTFYNSCCNIANCLYNLGRYDEAMEFVQTAYQVVDQHRAPGEQQYLDSFLGDLYAGLGENQKAEECYRKSIQDNDRSSTYDRIYARVRYCDFLSLRANRYDEALALINETEAKAKEWNVATFDLEIINQKVNSYEGLHRDKEALACYRQWVEQKNLLLSEEKEKAIRVVELKNEILQEQRKNALQQVELLEKDRRLILLGSVMLLLFISAIFLWVLNQRQKRRYEEIVRQQLEMLQARNQTSKLTDKNGHDLFAKLEALMRDQKVYTDPLLSIEKLAALLDTNRTYLSKVINEETGDSYSTYINNLRLEEAIARLSDPTDQTPMTDLGPLVGFNSQSSFYTLFKKKYKITPTLFRANVKIVVNQTTEKA